MARSKPLAIDLFCGLGGFTEGCLAEGYDVVGFDVERHVYGEHRYPAQLVLQDVLTIHGRQFKDADLIVASPPCQEYSYMAMPWSRAKAIAAEYRAGVRDVKKLTALFDACFRIQQEASEAAGRHVPLVVENVRGAQEWVGRSRFHFGSFHLWGDVPALMPLTAANAIKVPSFRFDGSGRSFQTASVRRTNVGNGARFTSRDCGLEAEGIKQRGSGREWFAGEGTIGRTTSSKSAARKSASALIAKIPFVLSRHIAASWKPDPTETRSRKGQAA